MKMEEREGGGGRPFLMTLKIRTKHTTGNQNEQGRGRKGVEQGNRAEEGCCIHADVSRKGEEGGMSKEAKEGRMGGITTAHIQKTL